MALLEHIKAEWDDLKRAPAAFVLLVIFSILAGIYIGHWHYSEQLDTKDSEIHRYRVALGIDNASQGALVELNNQELALKARSIVAQLRKLSSEWEAKNQQIKSRADAGKLTNEQRDGELDKAQEEIAQDFDENLASDAFNVDNELRKRLDPKAIAHVLRVPAFIERDSNGKEQSRVTLLALMRDSPLGVFYIKGLADEIEQMSDLLPADNRKP